MADAYLNLAEAVLIEVGRPLRPAEILEYAYAKLLLPEHLYGKTQHKTLHARLSEDIARQKDRSRFYRTAPGIFCLRSPTSEAEYHAPPRRRELIRDLALAVEAQVLDLTRSDQRTVSAGVLREYLKSGKYGYYPYKRIVADDNLIAIHSFVVVHRISQLLSYRVGKFAPTSDPLYGSRSIGLGGAVLASDVDMLFESMFGIVANGINELCFGLGLSRRLAERARYENQLAPWLGVVSKHKRGARRVLHVVLGYECPTEFTPTKAALSVNDLRWVDARSPGNNLSDYDSTSELLFQGDYVREFIRIGSNC